MGINFGNEFKEGGEMAPMLPKEHKEYVLTPEEHKRDVDRIKAKLANNPPQEELYRILCNLSGDVSKILTAEILKIIDK